MAGKGDCRNISLLGVKRQAIYRNRGLNTNAHRCRSYILGHLEGIADAMEDLEEEDE